MNSIIIDKSWSKVGYFHGEPHTSDRDVSYTLYLNESKLPKEVVERQKLFSFIGILGQVFYHPNNEIELDTHVSLRLIFSYYSEENFLIIT